MKKFIYLAIFGCISFVLITGCKPTSKNEITYWENNKKDLAEATAAYPNFKPLLDRKMADAQKMWDEAGKLSSEDEKAKKMKAANEFLNELLGQFTEIKYKKKGISDTITKFNNKMLAKNEDAIRYKAVHTAMGVLSEVDAALATAKPATEADAKVITKDQISKLISAQGAIDREMKAVEPKKTDAKKK